MFLIMILLMILCWGGLCSKDQDQDQEHEQEFENSV
jgi:hypothetical protein